MKKRNYIVTVSSRGEEEMELYYTYEVIITLIIAMALFAIFNSVVIILYTLISHDAFDKYINKEHYPEMVGKGLYKNNVEKDDSQLNNKEA